MNVQKKNVHRGQNIQKEIFSLDWHLAHQVATCNIMKHSENPENPDLPCKAFQT
jgi:hypothetical protein